MTRVVCIVHGKARSAGALCRELAAAFGGMELQIELTAHAGHAIALARSAAEGGCDAVVACGGDGTLNEVVNGLMQAGRPEVRMGILPIGSGNDFVRSFMPPAGPEALAVATRAGTGRQVDLGLAAFTGRDGLPAQRYFLNITDLGMGGEVAELLDGPIRRLGAAIAYQLAIVSKLLSYRKQQIAIEADTFQWKGRVMNLVMSNGKWFGKGLGISPEAQLSDGSLNAVILGNITLADYARHLGEVQKGLKINHPEVHYFPFHTLSVKQPDLPIDMDGDFVGYSPLTVQIVPAALRVIA